MNALANELRQQVILDRTRKLVSRLTDNQMLKGKPAQLTELEVTNICVLLNELLLEEPSCLELNLDNKLYIFGDIHGHYIHMLHTLNILGHPPAANYLFLGNCVGRGEQSIETIVLLFAYKLLYPHQVHILRGKHECDQLGRTYGFYTQCMKRFSSFRLWNTIMETFCHLPVAAIVEHTFFCTHSGISPSAIYSGQRGSRTLQKYISTWVSKPIETEANVLATQLVWSEPELEVARWERSPTGMGYLYGAEVVREFCEQFELFGIIRSNDLLPLGYEFLIPNRLLSLCSVPNYLGAYRNYGAVAELQRMDRSQTIVGRIKRIRPVGVESSKSFRRATVVVEDTKFVPVSNYQLRLVHEMIGESSKF